MRPLWTAFWFAALCPALAAGQSLHEPLANGGFGRLLAERSSEPQLLATLNTILGRADLNAGLRIPRSSTACSTPGAPLSGAAWLRDQAGSAKVLMFNEDHLSPGSRAFVRQMLPELRARGFTHIGFETFVPKEEGDSRPYTPASGYYSIEPVFAALVRDAGALGFEVFGYESTERSPPEMSRVDAVRLREENQAANIAKAIRSAPDTARFIIFAGWSHIAEAPLDTFGQPVQWMAARLKDVAKIDPLTVDLTGCVYTASPEERWDGRMYLSGPDIPLVVGQYSAAVDAQIRLPIPDPKDTDAPGFYRKLLGVRVEVPVELRSDEDTVLVQARGVGEAAAEVAFDRVMLKPGENLPLYLPAGTYELVSHRSNGREVGRRVIQVASDKANDARDRPK